LSTLTTRALPGLELRRYLIDADPMNPAPPVTKMVSQCILFSLWRRPVQAMARPPHRRIGQRDGAAPLYQIMGPSLYTNGPRY
jgi:hypothetical protein